MAPEDSPGKKPHAQILKRDRGHVKVPHPHLDNELNRVLGGGIIPGSLILIGGSPV